MYCIDCCRASVAPLASGSANISDLLLSRKVLYQCSQVLYGAVQFLASGVRVIFSMLMSGTVSALLVFSNEPDTFRVLPLDTERVRGHMTAPCSVAVKFARPSHHRVSTNFSASDVVAPAISSTVVGHGDECM